MSICLIDFSILVSDNSLDLRDFTLYLIYDTLSVIYGALYYKEAIVCWLNFMINLNDISLILVDCIFGKDKLVIVASDSSFYCWNSVLYRWNSILYFAHATVSLMKTLVHLGDISLALFNAWEGRHRTLNSSRVALDLLLHKVHLLTLLGQCSFCSCKPTL